MNEAETLSSNLPSPVKTGFSQPLIFCSARMIAVQPHFVRLLAGLALSQILMLGACARFPESMNASHRVGQIYIETPPNHSAVKLSWTNGNVLRTYLIPRPVPYSISYGVSEALKSRISHVSQLNQAQYVLEFREEVMDAFFRFTDNPLGYHIKVILKDLDGRLVAESGCGGTTSFGRMGIEKFLADPDVLRGSVQNLVDECTNKIAAELD